MEHQSQTAHSSTLMLNENLLYIDVRGSDVSVHTRVVGLNPVVSAASKKTVFYFEKLREQMWGFFSSQKL